MKLFRPVCIFGLLASLCATSLWSVPRMDDFYRGIAYYLLQDDELAGKYLKSYFSANPQPTISMGYTLLLAGERWESAKRFKDYLDSDHRSLEALTGISLAVSDLNNMTAVEYLNRTLRMNPNYSPALLGLGMEWVRRRNYPAADQCFQKALKATDLPEYRLVTASFYLQNQAPDKALAVLGGEIDRLAGNYHLNYLQARALLDLNRTAEAAASLQRALASRPNAPSALLLQARILLQQGDVRRALSVAKGLKFPSFNAELEKTLARIYLEQQSGDAEKYLYEVFAQDRWDPDINLMLGLYHLRRKNPIIQNWITRSLLAGADPRKVRSLFPAEYEFPDFKALPFFEVKRLAWLGRGMLAVFGRAASGEDEGVTLFDPATFKPLRTLRYTGTFLDLLPGSSGDRLVFATAPEEGARVAVYSLKIAAKGGGDLTPLTPAPLRLSSVLAALSPSGSTLYLTDGAMTSIAFESPFTIPGGGLGRATPVYPRYPFPIYTLPLTGGPVGEIRDKNKQRQVPIVELQRYFTVVDAIAARSEIADLIQKGQGLDLTSSESVRIRFPENRPDALLIQLVDLKNSLRGFAYDARGGKLDALDGTRFLGPKRYAELELVRFDPDQDEVTVWTKDQEKDLFVFNYRTRLFKKVASKVLQVARNDAAGCLYILSERNNYIYYSETSLAIVRLQPYASRKITSRRDLARCLDCSAPEQPVFSTYNGETVQLVDDDSFRASGPSWEGALYAHSPDATRTGAWINGRLFLLKGPATP